MSTDRHLAAVVVAALLVAPVPSFAQALNGPREGFAVPVPSPADRPVIAPPVPGVDAPPPLEPLADSAVALMADVGFTRGHVIVGDELVKLGRWVEALPHFLHPLDELYGDVGPRLDRFGAPPFDAELKRLVQAVRARRADAYQEALAALGGRLDEVEGSVRAASSDWADTSLQATVALVKQTIGEYETALKGPYVVNSVEYQDGRGFALEAKRCLSASSADLESAHGAAFVATLTSDLDALLKTWPTTLPARSAVSTPTFVQTLIDWFRIHARGLK